MGQLELLNVNVLTILIAETFHNYFVSNHTIALTSSEFGFRIYCLSFIGLVYLYQIQSEGIIFHVFIIAVYVSYLNVCLVHAHMIVHGKCQVSGHSFNPLR